MGFDRAFGDEIETVFVSEWDEAAQKTYKANFKTPETIYGDITEIEASDIPEFDICLAGFPCQAFSLAGQHMGFDDDYKGICRGTLFVDVARICEYHKPKVIFCENVKGLSIHDKGRTFKIICSTFRDLGYTVFFDTLNSKNFGVPQNRERIYIVAFRNDIAPKEFIFPQKTDDTKKLKDIIEETPVSSKYYLSEVYLDTLRKHKARHEAKGNGFGYEIRDWNGTAGAVVCGGMGRERNLIIDRRQTDLNPTTHIKGNVNGEGVRKLTPREWARLQGFPDSFKLPLADVHIYKQFGNSVTVNVIEAIARKIKDVLSEEGLQMANRGEWSEPYAALRIIGDRKLFLADEEGNKNPLEWMDVLELIRHETRERMVSYKYSSELMVDINVNDVFFASVPAVEFLSAADQLKEDIQKGAGNSFAVSSAVLSFLKKIELLHIKAKSVDKSDLFLSIHDPRAGIAREHIGFSVKSEFGKDSTLFNTAKASAAIYRVSHMDDALMEKVNGLYDSKDNVAVSARCKMLLDNKCELEFCGFPVAERAKCKAFEENLDLIDSRLIRVFDRLLWNHFFLGEQETDINKLIDKMAEENPCGISRPEIKYPYMMKSFIYAAYCGMTASTLWDGKSQVNGGFIKVKANGDVLAHYALESDQFKTYLYNHCYLEFPATDIGHGNYAKVYKEGDKYYFRLNFQIRYR